MNKLIDKGYGHKEISAFVSIPDAIFDRIDFKSCLTNEDIKLLFKRITELEEENKKLCVSI